MKTIQNCAANVVSRLFNVRFLRFVLRAKREICCFKSARTRFRRSSFFRFNSETNSEFYSPFLRTVVVSEKSRSGLQQNLQFFSKSVSSPKNALFPAFFPSPFHAKILKLAATVKVYRGLGLVPISINVAPTSTVATRRFRSAVPGSFPTPFQHRCRFAPTPFQHRCRFVPTPFQYCR